MATWAVWQRVPIYSHLNNCRASCRLRTFHWVRRYMHTMHSLWVTRFLKAARDQTRSILATCSSATGSSVPLGTAARKAPGYSPMRRMRPGYSSILAPMCLTMCRCIHKSCMALDSHLRLSHQKAHPSDCRNKHRPTSTPMPTTWVRKLGAAQSSVQILFFFSAYSII